MKLVRYGAIGQEKPGLIDKSGQLRDLSAQIKDLNGEAYSPASLTKLTGLDASKLPAVDGKPRFGAPVTGISKFVAIGLNYADHAAESGSPVPDEPLMWFKAPSAIIAHHETVEVAFPDHRTDYEGELVIVIGKKAKGVSQADAPAHIFGCMPGQDISDRVVQRSESQWARAKSMDTYAPLGPFITTDLDASNLPIQTLVNGEIRQDSNTNQLVFSPAQLVAFLSEAITLEPGDCIMTGTPFGIAALQDGDVIETRIGEMAPLINPVRFRR